MRISVTQPTVVEEPINPCVPNPCGPNSECRAVGSTPSCSCLVDFIGSPPNCRPECTINSECSSNLACMRQKCKDPCPGSCGTNAECSVVNHTPICTCLNGYTGDPFTSCHPKPPRKSLKPKTKKKNSIQFNSPQILAEKEPVVDPCNPSPCGPNAQCDNGVCTCLPEYLGDPYRGCRPECVLNSDCPKDKACIRSKCIDPCPGTCGQNAVCNVINHIPTCTCLPNYVGNAFTLCSLIQGLSKYSSILF